MILMGDRKKALTAILGPESDNVGVASDGGPSDLEHACGELLAALDGKDAPALASAFRACMAACDSETPAGEG